MINHMINRCYHKPFGLLSVGFLILSVSGVILINGRAKAINNRIERETPAPLFVDTGIERDLDLLLKVVEERKEAEFVPGEILVKFRPGVVNLLRDERRAQVLIQSHSIETLNQRFGVRKMERVFKEVKKPDVQGMLEIRGKRRRVPDLTNTYRLKLNEQADILAIIEEYRKNPDIEYAEPNYIARTCLTPNDPKYADGTQWSLNQANDCDIDAPEAWDIETGSSDVIVAIVDTGVDYNHPDLSSNKVILGDDYVNNDSDPMDDNGHGTHCAGIAGAVTNNGVGIAGVSWGSKILAIKVLNSSGSGSYANVANGITYATNNGADIISLSLGGSSDSQTLEDAVNYAYNLGCVIIAAAGNSATADFLYPAAYEHVVAVGATTSQDKRSGYSNYGFWVDISAPGNAIYSTLWDDTYSTKSGTSMACPHVAGVAALVLSQYPELSNDEVSQRVISTADNIDSLNEYFSHQMGTGRLNAYRALTDIAHPNIIYNGHLIDDSSGNNNGEVNPGETINLALTLKNTWQQVNNVSATLTTESEFITIHTNYAYFGNISGGATSTNNDNPYVFTVDANCPLGYAIPFTLEIQGAGGYSKSESFFVRMEYPELAGWPQEALSMYYNNSPVYADIDGDNDLEIIVPTQCIIPSLVYAWHHDGTLVDGWPVEISHPDVGFNLGTAAVGDIDGDGDVEVIVGTYRYGIYAFHHTGELVDGWPVSLSEPFDDRYYRAHTSALADLDDDGALEVIVAESRYYGTDTSFGSKLYILKGDGTPFSDSWPLSLPALCGVPASIAVGDINLDGKIEIAVNTVIYPYNMQIYIYHQDGTLVDGWPQPLGPELHMVTFGDLDNDGDLEIIAFSYRQGYAWHHDGTLVDGWPSEYGFTVGDDGVAYMGHANNSPPSLADLDGDGYLEIIFTFSRYDENHIIHEYIGVLNHDGTMANGWPVEVIQDDSSSQCNPAIGDLDGDGDLEIVVGYGYSGTIYAYHHNGILMDGFPIWTLYHKSLDTIGSSPAIGDVDGDGDVEIIVGTYSGMLHIYDCSGSYNPDNIKWPMNYQNIWHTGVAPTVCIDHGASSTQNREVTLNLHGPAKRMIISENGDFSGASWENYASIKSFTLSENEGEKTVYAKFDYGAGNISATVSDTITYTLSDTDPPGEVTGFTITAPAAGNSLSLSWTNPTDSDFAGTMIRRKIGGYPTGPTDGVQVYDGTGTSHIDTGLTDGTTYYYTAFTYDEVPNYSSGAQASATPADITPPGNVTNFTATSGDTQIVLSWINPTDSDFAGTMIRRKTGGFPTGPTDGVQVYSSTGTSHIDTGLINGTTYYYAAFTYDEIPNYSSGVEASATPSADITPPGNVTNFTATSGDTQIVLSWINPTDSDFAGVRIQRKTGSYPSGPSDGTNVYSGAGTSHTDTNLTNGTTYYYAAFSYDNAPHYSSGVEASATPADITPPGNVTNFTATSGDTQISLSWTNPTDSDFAGTRAMRKVGSYPSNPDDGVQVYDGQGSGYLDTGLTDGTTYYYKAFTYDEVPNYSSGAQASATPADLIPPANVTNFTATSGDTQISLSWTNPTDSDFAGVRIQRKTEDYSLDPGDGTNVYSGTGTSHTDTNLTNGTTYYYTAFTYDEVPNYSSGAQASATPADTTPPGEVTNFKAIAGNSQVVLSWSKPTDSDCAGTKLMRKTTDYPEDVTDGTLVYNGTGESYTDTGLTNDVTYYYKAFAYDEVPNYSSAVASKVRTTPCLVVATSDIDNVTIENTITVTDEASNIKNTQVIIPANALSAVTTVTIGEIQNPPTLPSGLTGVGTTISLGPEGQSFDYPVTLKISYTDADLTAAGVSDPNNLIVYTCDTSTSDWEQVAVTEVNTINKLVSVEVTSFSFYRLVFSVAVSGGGGGGGGGGCFIATAAYGTSWASEVQSLSTFRDKYLLTNDVGRALVKFYYCHSPSLADFIRNKEPLKAIVRTELRPIVWLITKLIK